MMDIVERLRKNSAAQENGPYVGLKENRDCMSDAANEIERLRVVLIAAKAEERERIIGIVQNIKPTLDAHKYPSDSERHLLKVAEAGMRGLIVDAIMEDET